MFDATAASKLPAYTLTARALHWITAALVLAMISAGIVIANDWGGPVQEPLYDLHKATGALLLPLVVARLIYRLTHAPAPLPPDIPALQQTAAHATHWMLYVLLIVQPIVGWVATSAYPAPLPFFGLFHLPPIWPEDRDFSDQMFGYHRLIGLVLAAVAAVHIGAALSHYFIRKDRVLMRMITG